MISLSSNRILLFLIFILKGVVLLRFVLLLLMLTSLEASDIAWYKSYAKASDIAQKDKKPLLVYMHSDCGACRYLDTRVLNDENVADFINQHFIAVSLDLKNDAPKALQVAVAPVFHYINYDGTFIQDDLIGATPATSFLKDLKSAVKVSGTH
jgi:thioredoxin-related protein